MRQMSDIIETDNKKIIFKRVKRWGGNKICKRDRNRVWEKLRKVKVIMKEGAVFQSGSRKRKIKRFKKKK